MIIPVVRTYSNERVFKLIKRLDKIDILKKVYVVINEIDDTISTGARLSEMKNRLDINLIHLCDYGWSKALNVAIKILVTTTDSPMMSPRGLT